MFLFPCDVNGCILDTIPKRDFQGCFQAWQKRWDCCLRAKGEYFEGDGGI